MFDIKNTAVHKLIEMYKEGFGKSKLARQLLFLIIIKVAILLLVFKLWLMPDRLNSMYDTDTEKAQGVRDELINRHSPSSMPITQ